MSATLVLFCSCSLFVFDSDDEEEDGTEEEDDEEEEEEEKEDEEKPAKIKFIKGQLMIDCHLYHQLCLSY